MSGKWRYFLFILFAFIFSVSFGQQHNYPLHYELHNVHNKLNLQAGSPVHTGLRPINQQFSGNTIQAAYEDSIKVYTNFHLKLLKRHLVEIKGKDYNLYFDPLLRLELGGDLIDTSGRGTFQDDGGTFYINTRGFQAMGNLGDKFSFYTSFYENQSFFPDYLRQFNVNRGEYYWNGSTYVQQFKIVPGQGRAKEFKGTGFDYAMVSGHISYAIHPNINLQFGHGKHFIGHGYRSLLLSDNAFNYPYWSVRTQFLKGKLNYSFIYTYLQNLYRLPEHTAPEATFVRKNGSFHYLSFMPADKLEIGIFEATMWRVYDSTKGSVPIPVQSYSPVIFTSLLANGFNAPFHNVLAGINAKYEVSDKIMTYGQMAIDDPKNGRIGYQLGIKLFDFFKKGVIITSEVNTVAPYTYAKQHVWQNYAHYNQELAHPYGADFFEWVSYIKYPLPNRFWLTYKYNLAKIPHLTGKNDGNNIFRAYYDEKEAHENKYFLQFHQLRAGYKANVKTNMNIYLGMNYRNLNDNNILGSLYVYAGISTDLINHYYDF